LGEAGAEDGLRRAALAVALERDARQAARDEREVVERAPGARPQGAEAADAVAAQLGLGLDVVDDAGREGAALLPLGRHSAAFHTSSSLRSKFHSLRPATTFLNDAGAGTR